jgi:hypothetical protein
MSDTTRTNPNPGKKYLGVDSLPQSSLAARLISDEASPKRVVGIEIRGLAHTKNKILSFSFSTPKFSVKLRDKN